MKSAYGFGLVSETRMDCWNKPYAAQLSEGMEIDVRVYLKRSSGHILNVLSRLPPIIDQR